MHDETLICRSCKVAADRGLVNGETLRISCPSCGIFLEGDAAARMQRDQFNYFSGKKFQDINRRVFAKTKSKNITISHRPAKLRDPGHPFIFWKPKP